MKWDTQSHFGAGSRRRRSTVRDMRTAAAGPVGLHNEGQIGAGAKMAAVSLQDNGPCPFRQAAENPLDVGDHLGIDGVSFCGPRQPHERHRSGLTDDHAVRQVPRGLIDAAIHANFALGRNARAQLVAPVVVPCAQRRGWLDQT